MTAAISGAGPADPATIGDDYWISVPAGPFLIGTDEQPPDGEPSASAPMHTVQVAAFDIARRPVTVADFGRFVAATGHVTTAERKGESWIWHGSTDNLTPDQDHLWKATPGASWRAPRGPGSDLTGKDDHPVTHVSYQDCLAYCEWAGTRLPTEAEWEKAARGTDGRNYPWGNEPPTAETCNHSMNVGDTTPVGRYPAAAGALGPADMAGNVWEIMGNGYHRYPYAPDKTKRLTTPKGTVELGVIRGGSFYNNCSPRGVLVWVRIYNPPDYSCYDMGFRVCRA